MSVTHSTEIRNDIADAVLAQIDVDAAAGYVEMQDSGGTEVATLNLSYPAGTVTAEKLTFDAISNDASATGGTLAKFEIKSNIGTSKLAGAIGISGSDINSSILVVDSGWSVQISLLTYTAPE